MLIGSLAIFMLASNRISKPSSAELNFSENTLTQWCPHGWRSIAEEMFSRKISSSLAKYWASKMVRPELSLKKSVGEIAWKFRVSVSWKVLNFLSFKCFMKSFLLKCIFVDDYIIRISVLHPSLELCGLPAGSRWVWIMSKSYCQYWRMSWIWTWGCNSVFRISDVIIKWSTSGKNKKRNET